MTQVTLAATQMACTWATDENVARAEGLVREAGSSPPSPTSYLAPSSSGPGRVVLSHETGVRFP